MLAIACGNEDADDCDALRCDPLFKLAVRRAPESGHELCSQLTMSRLENMPSRVEAEQMRPLVVGVHGFKAGLCVDAAWFCERMSWQEDSLEIRMSGEKGHSRETNLSDYCRAYMSP